MAAGIASSRAHLALVSTACGRAAARARPSTRTCLGSSVVSSSLNPCWQAIPLSSASSAAHSLPHSPFPIAEHLADWALRGQDNAGVVLDPTCGEGVFLLAAAEKLAGTSRASSGSRLYGVDVHAASLFRTKELVDSVVGSPSTELVQGDFFEEPTPGQIGARLPLVDAVVGNPPFVRYHEHRGDVRRRARAAALAQGVRLSGLASSWAALLVHASAFLKPDGRIAMVLPAELLSVGYAEPIRVWLRHRFRSVHLVLFDHLQFRDAEEQVVLLVARGTGGCNAFTLHHVTSADELNALHIFDADAFAPRESGKLDRSADSGSRTQHVWFGRR